MSKIKPLKVAQLYRKCDLSRFNFKNTNDLEDLDLPFGQQRAINALELGVDMPHEGYNIYMLGRPGSGKFSTAQQFLTVRATEKPAPMDWMYVSNFQHAHKPFALSLPAGNGVTFAEDMRRLMDEMRSAIPAAFETEEYQLHAHEIESEFEEQREKAFEELTNDAKQHNIRLLRTPGGFAFAPTLNDEVIHPKEYGRLPEQDRKRIEERIAVLEENLQNVVRHIPQWQRQAREKLKTLDREVAKFAVSNLIEELKIKYAPYANALDYLQNVEADIIDNAAQFRRREEKPSLFDGALMEETLYRRYEVNILIDNSQTKGAPVVYEDNPSFQNLFGRIEHVSQFGVLTTDFTQIKSGSLHRANGGYLIIDAHKLLSHPFCWEELKRTLGSKEMRIHSPTDLLGLTATSSLEPQAIPLDIKIVLIGDRTLYYLLTSYDPEFSEYFKIAADFEDSVERSNDNHLLYARLIATLARKNNLMAIDRNAVALIIERMSRHADDVEKISTHVVSVLEIMQEAEHYARQVKRSVVKSADIHRALAERTTRVNRIQLRIYEELQRGSILLDTQGEKVAQVNALSVLDMGNYMFGQPSRITATARLGDGDVVDIEREVDLGGPLHSKGVMILSAFLGARYAKNKPLSLSASIVFEQNYGQVEGDSATLAELCALISAISELPINQNLAITGSMNQLGEVQPIGGVNEKIESFFMICNQRKLTGTQGVIMPKANLANLMLEPYVLDAVKKQQFAVYAIDHADQALELLLGLPIGRADKKGNYPKDTINRHVVDKLDELTHQHQVFGKSSDKDGAHSS